MNTVTSYPIPVVRRQPRSGGTFTEIEKDVFSKYKDEYRQQVTRELRGMVMKEKILPAIFNYWQQQKKGRLSEKESISKQKLLAGWIHNNWRPIKTLVNQKDTSIRINPLHEVYKTKRADVDAEVKLMMGDNQDGTMAFALRPKACKNILDRMPEEERRIFDTDIKERRKNGNPPKTQQEKADKLADKSICKVADQLWKDMGISTVVFSVYTDSQGRLVGDCHEDISKQMGYRGHSFGHRYKNEVNEMTRHLLDFIKSIRSNRESATRVETAGILGAAAEAGTAVGKEIDGTQGTATINVIKSSNRFPKLPVEVKGELTKKQSEILLRQYLSDHYSLASGHLNKQVPFEQVGKDIARFIAPEHRPDNIVLKDPRNMHKEDVIRLLRHIYERQLTVGLENAFRFRIILGKEKRDENPKYPDPQIPRTRMSTDPLPTSLTPEATATLHSNSERRTAEKSSTAIESPVRNTGRGSTSSTAINSTRESSMAVQSSMENNSVRNVGRLGKATDPPIRITRSRTGAGVVKGKGKAAASAKTKSRKR